MIPCPYGFRIVGGCAEERRLVDHAAAFSAYAACDDRAQVDQEGFLSAFTFGQDFRDLLKTTGSCKGFAGLCWSAWLWWDIDREGNLDAALADARRLAIGLVERFGLDDHLLLAFYSGAKGFHIGLPTGVWGPAPSLGFNAIARRFAEHVADALGVNIDSGVYDKVRPFRAPNSRHPKTGLHKRRLTLDELLGLSLPAILELAKGPAPFDVPSAEGLHSEPAAAAWSEAERRHQEQAEAKANRRTAANGAPTLNRQTFEFIRNGADKGDRHRLLFSAAANLAEFGCPPGLAHALLAEGGLDSGLPPADVRRQINSGLAHVQGQAIGAGETLSPMPNNLDDLALVDQEPPRPPPGALLILVDDKARPCSAKDCHLWTWEGANRWFYAFRHPLPPIFRGGNEQV